MTKEAAKLSKSISLAQTKLLSALMQGLSKAKNAEDRNERLGAMFAKIVNWIVRRYDPDDAAVEELCSIISAGEVGTMTDLQEAAMRFSQCTPEKQAAILTILRHQTREAEA